MVDQEAVVLARSLRATEEPVSAERGAQAAMRQVRQDFRAVVVVALPQSAPTRQQRWAVTVVPD